MNFNDMLHNGTGGALHVMLALGEVFTPGRNAPAQEKTIMTVDDALASLAVKDLDRTAAWYATLFGSAANRPMPEVAERMFPRGGGLRFPRDQSGRATAHARSW